MAYLYRPILQSGVGPSTLLLMVFRAVVSSCLAVLPPHFLGVIAFWKQ